MSGFDIGSFLGAIVSATGLGIGRSGMHPQTGADLAKNAAEAGLSPLALAGQPLQGGFGASVGDPGMAGQMLGRAIHQGGDQDSKLRSLHETSLALDIERKSIDNEVALQSANSLFARVHGQPGNITSMDPTQYFGGRGDKYAAVPVYSPMYDPITGAHPLLATREASTRSFGSLGEPTSRAMGDYAAIVNAWNVLQKRRQDVGTSFSEGPFPIGPITVRPDVLRNLGKIQDRLPFEDF